ncbi:uncharacterized protein LOC126763902 isoform X2 [Bactrocera neohumeralis]|uniref:uncharacterized protein LOC126763902 isoform X2 n=1 Tax=Bactrocera neohumeralis TaxID=98809 RepID=UPI002165D80A|nr:uncharacterized protein LOC126763902 isoform X2 [Bactrocera neohumeralis]
MSRVNSPTNNSGSSSETSEVQSFEDNKTFAESPVSKNLVSQNRSPKSIKEFGSYQSGDKEGETKRPPWRAVSVSTLPKPDKNAILKAKLLDASRRLRAGKTSIGLQTYLEPTKLLRDVNLGIQKDLLLFKDTEIQTDGFYTKKTNNGETFILTYSVAQMTDYVRVSNEATQTLLPRIPGDIFLNTYLINYGKINELRDRNVIEKDAVSADYGKRNKKLHYKSDNSMDPGLEKSVPNIEIDIKELRKNNFRPNLQQPTLLSWNFEYGDLAADNNSKKFVPYAIQANHSPRSFISPQQESSIYHGNDRYYIEKDCELFLLSIDELLQEINRLVDIIEDNPSENKYYNKSTTESIHFKYKPLFIPSEKWLPIIIKEEKQLQDMMKEMNI